MVPLVGIDQRSLWNSISSASIKFAIIGPESVASLI